MKITLYWVTSNGSVVSYFPQLNAALAYAELGRRMGYEVKVYDLTTTLTTEIICNMANHMFIHEQLPDLNKARRIS
jgi:hypothetical protein